MTVLFSDVCECSVMSDSLWPHGLGPATLLCPWDFPGKNTGVGCHFLLQGIFLTQELNLISSVFCAGRWILYRWPSGKPALGVFLNLVMSPGAKAADQRSRATASSQPALESLPSSDTGSSSPGEAPSPYAKAVKECRVQPPRPWVKFAPCGWRSERNTFMATTIS